MTVAELLKNLRMEHLIEFRIDNYEYFTTKSNSQATKNLEDEEIIDWFAFSDGGRLCINIKGE